jgi:hypothetical protein
MFNIVGALDIANNFSKSIIQLASISISCNITAAQTINSLFKWLFTFTRDLDDTQRLEAAKIIEKIPINHREASIYSASKLAILLTEPESSASKQAFKQYIDSPIQVSISKTTRAQAGELMESMTQPDSINQIQLSREERYKRIKKALEIN